MGKMGQWAQEQSDLVDEAMLMGIDQAEELIQYVKDNMRGRPIDRNYILKRMADSKLLESLTKIDG